jgi:hypothetical protein
MFWEGGALTSAECGMLLLRLFWESARVVFGGERYVNHSRKRDMRPDAGALGTLTPEAS